MRRGAGQKISVFVHAQGIKTVHAGGGGVKKWQNSVHVVVEWPHRNFIPAPLASQSAPLMNTCWPVLRTCNSNTFVLFWASCIHKKNFYNPKITPLQIMFSKRFFLLLRRKKNLCKLHSYFLHNQTKQNRNVFSVQILRHFYKAPCEIKSVRC